MKKLSELFVVIHESGFGDSSMELVGSRAECDQHIEDFPGTQNEPMPEWAEYWDQVGYDYKVTLSLETVFCSLFQEEEANRRKAISQSLKEDSNESAGSFELTLESAFAG